MASEESRRSTKRAVSLPLEPRPRKFPRTSIDSDESESNSPEPRTFYYLDDSCLTDAESSTCDVPDDEIDDDALQPSTPALCTKCQSISLDDMITQGAKNMQVGKYKDKLGYRLHDSLYDLGNSALTGCRLCQIILIEAKRYLQPPETETYRNIVAGLYDNNGLSDLPVFIRLSTKSIHFCGTFDVHIPLGDLDSTTIASLEIEAKDQDQLPFSNVGRPCQYDLGSPLAFVFMKDCFQECLEQHVACKSETPDLPSLPTRVIDVGDVTTPPRLITGFPNKGRWVALSHCWGGVVDYTLTKGNRESRYLGMSMNELPATFRDAILVTRNLNIQYIWIDAICIIQDSLDEDWPKEASHMREYYMNSVLTISAMNAENSKKGILQKRLPCFQPLPLSLKSEQLDWEGSLAIRESHPKTLDFWKRRPVSALTTRGWTFQESCLPPRTLHFTSSGLVWECLCHTAVEWLHEPFDHQSEFKSLVRPSPVDNSNNEEKDQLLEPKTDCGENAMEGVDKRIFDSWDELIHFYSERKLTYASDKLSAISGIASMFSTLLPGDQYLAGLWKSKLLEGLCWHLCSCANISPSRPGKYRAPSWSWASIDGGIILDHDTPTHNRVGYDKYRAKILEARVDCESHNAFGQVSGGILRLCGLWLPIYLDEFPEWHAEEGPGTFYFVLQEIDRDNDQLENFTHHDLWKGHVKTQSLNILHPSYYSCLNSQRASPETSSISEDAEYSDDHSTDEEDRWRKDAPNWTCVPFARLDIVPKSEGFLGESGQFCIGVLMLSESCFLLLQPNKHSPETYSRIGIADASWIQGRLFSDEYIEKNTREIVVM